jgi:glycosyltransferase involved in cell wall biosynthesis
MSQPDSKNTVNTVDTADTTVPTISVVIPCYNHGEFLDEAVQSVFGQSVQDFEILIVNDGSTDRATNALLADYARPKTRVIHCPENNGLPAARNTALKECVGEYICLLDADDSLERTYFSKALRVLEEDPSIAFVSHWLRTFGDEHWQWTPQRCDLNALLDLNTVNGAALVRRELLFEIGLFDEAMRDGCEDWELWIRMVQAGHRGIILPEVLFNYRRRADSMSRLMARSDIRQKHFRYLIEKHRESYALHFDDLLFRRDLAICDMKRQIHDLDKEAEEWFAPQMRRRQEEAIRLRHRVAQIDRRDAVARELKSAKDQVAEAIRSSTSARTECDRLRSLLEAEQCEREANSVQSKAEIARVKGLLATQLTKTEALMDEKSKELESLGSLLAANEKRANENHQNLSLEVESLTEKLGRESLEVHSLTERLAREAADQQELNLSRRQLIGLRAALDNANDALEAFYESASWKMTSPARRVFDGLRRLRRGRS